VKVTDLEDNVIRVEAKLRELEAENAELTIDIRLRSDRMAEQELKLAASVAEVQTVQKALSDSEVSLEDHRSRLSLLEGEVKALQALKRKHEAETERIADTLNSSKASSVVRSFHVREADNGSVLASTPREDPTEDRSRVVSMGVMNRGGNTSVTESAERESPSDTRMVESNAPKDMTSLLSEHLVEFETMQAVFEDMKKKNAALEERAACLQQEKSGLSDELDKCKADLSSVSSKLGSVSDREEDAIREIGELSAQLAIQLDEAAKARDELNAHQIKHHQEMKLKENEEELQQDLIDTLTERVAELMRRQGSTQDELVKSENKLQAVANSRLLLETRAIKLDSQVEEMSSNAEGAKIAMDRLSEANRMLVDQASTRGVQLEAAAIHFEELEVTLASIDADAHRVRSLYFAMRSEKERLEAANKDLRSLNQSLAEEATKTNDKLARSSGRLAELEASVSTYKADFENLQSEVVEMKSRKGDTSAVHSGLGVFNSEEFLATKRELESTRTDLEVSKNRVSYLEGQLGDLVSRKKELDSTKEIYAASEKRRSALEGQAELLRAQKKRLQGDMDTLESQVASLSNETSSPPKVDDSKTMQGKSGGSLQLRAAYDDLKIQNDELASQMNNIAREKSSLELELQTCKDALEEQKNEFSTLSRKADKLLAGEQKMFKEMQKVRREMATKCSDADREVQALQKEIRSLRADPSIHPESARSDQFELQDTVARLTEELRASKQRAEQLSFDVGALQGMVEGLESAKAEVTEQLMLMEDEDEIQQELISNLSAELSQISSGGVLLSKQPGSVSQKMVRKPIAVEAEADESRCSHHAPAFRRITPEVQALRGTQLQSRDEVLPVFSLDACTRFESFERVMKASAGTLRILYAKNLDQKRENAGLVQENLFLVDQRRRTQQEIVETERSLKLISTEMEEAISQRVLVTAELGLAKEELTGLAEEARSQQQSFEESLSMQSRELEDAHWLNKDLAAQIERLQSIIDTFDRSKQEGPSTPVSTGDGFVPNQNRPTIYAGQTPGSQFFTAKAVDAQKSSRKGRQISHVLPADDASVGTPRMIHVVPDDNTKENFNLEELPSLLEAAIAQSAERQNQVEISRAALARALQKLDSPCFENLEQLNFSPLLERQKLKSDIGRQGPFISDVEGNEVSLDCDDEQVSDDEEGTSHADAEKKTFPPAEAMEGQVDRLALQVNRLEEQNMELRAERDGLEQENTELQESFACVSAQYAEVSARESKLNSEYDSFTARFKSLKALNVEHIQLIEEEVLQVREELKKKSGSAGAVDKQAHDQLKATVEKLWKQCEDRCARESMIEPDYDPFKSKLKLLHDLNLERSKSLENTLGELKRDLAETLDREKIFEARCGAYTAEILALRSTFLEEKNIVEETLRACQQKLDREHLITKTLRSEVEGLRVAMADTREENHELLADNNVMRHQIEKISYDKAELECELRQVNGESDHYMAVNQNQAREIDALVLANDRLERRIQCLDERSVKKHQAMAAKNAWLGEQLGNSQKRIMELKSDCESAKARFTESVDQRATVEGDLRERHRNLEECLAKVQKETEELRDQIAKAGELNASISQERDALSKEVNECKREMEQLSAERDTFRQRDEQLQRDVGSFWGW